MKNILILFFMVISGFAFGQTADYNIVQQRTHAKAIDDKHAFVYEIGPDTLDASVSPDTLTITFEQSFYGLMNLYAPFYQVDGDLVGEIAFYQLVGNSDVMWDMGGADIPGEGNENVDGVEAITLEGTKLVVQIIAESGGGIISGSVVLKPL